MPDSTHHPPYIYIYIYIIYLDFSRSLQINEQDEIVPAPYDLCNAGALPNQATSGSSSNDIPPVLVDADENNSDGVDSDQANPHANESSFLSMQVLRSLDWQNMLDGYSNLEGMAQRKSAAQFKGGLDRRLRRRRRFLSG